MASILMSYLRKPASTSASASASASASTSDVGDPEAPRETIDPSTSQGAAAPPSVTGETDEGDLDSPRLMMKDELLSWQLDNEFILSGYRAVSGSFSRSFRSLGHLHNETVNIYSHLFGTVLFLVLPAYVFSAVYPHYDRTQLADFIVFSTFFFGVAICFFLSAGFHTVANHSENVAGFANQLDYIGVVILMWGSTIPSVYYGFYCDPKLQKVYWAFVTTLAAASVAATLYPKFSHPKLRPYRTLMYAGLGLSAIVFIVHGIVIHGWEIQNRRMSLSWMLVMGALNLIGAAIYAARIPERWFPYRHDLFGSSHQIFHFMVVFAALTHMFGLLFAFDHLYTEINPCTGMPRAALFLW